MSRRNIALSASALLLCVSWLVWALPESPAPKGPHPFMSDQEKCDLCHAVTWKGAEGALEEKRFSRSLIEVCNGCHKARIGRSHPVGMNPFGKIPRETYPAGLPLQWSEELSSEVITCATCHDLHGERFADRKLYPRQKPHPEGGGRYLTYHLRVRGEKSKQGYAPLCKSCHPSY